MIVERTKIPILVEVEATTKEEASVGKLFDRIQYKLDKYETKKNAQINKIFYSLEICMLRLIRFFTHLKSVSFRLFFVRVFTGSVRPFTSMTT